MKYPLGFKIYHVANKIQSTEFSREIYTSQIFRKIIIIIIIIS